MAQNTRDWIEIDKEFKAKKPKFQTFVWQSVLGTSKLHIDNGGVTGDGRNMYENRAFINLELAKAFSLVTAELAAKVVCAANCTAGTSTPEVYSCSADV